MDGFFSGCFSYNANTKPTPRGQKDVASRVHVCDFSDPDDGFSRFVLEEWDAFRKRGPART